MKKILSLVLALVMIMAMTIPTYAAMPDTVEPRACIHDNTLIPYGEPQFDGDRYRDATRCQDCYIVKHRCTACNAIVTRIEWIDGTDQPHSYVVYKATCDGTTQLWYYHCAYCSHAKPGSPTPVTCKRAHINGVCTTLPI